MALALLLLKALASGERWITIRPPGHDKGQPLLIREQPDGSAKVIGGAGGSLNHLRLHAIRSVEDYKAGASSRAKLHREEKKRQRDRDKKDGLVENKTAAREALKDQVGKHEADFVQKVAQAMGWTQDDLRFPEESYQNASPEARDKAAQDHARMVFQRAQNAVDMQRKRLVADAEARSHAGLGEVPLSDPDPHTLSVQDLDPVESATKGLGFDPKYGERAAAHGLTPEERKAEGG